MSLSESALQTALRSRVKLVGEAGLDREHGRPLTIELSGKIVEITRSSRAPLPYRIVLQAESAPADPIHAAEARVRPWILFATLSDSAAPLPFSAGDQLSVYYRARWDKAAGLTRRAVSIRDGEGRLLLAFQDQDLLDAAHLPVGLEVTPDTRSVYVEAGRLSRLCYTVVEHSGLKVKAQGPARVLAPGTGEEVVLDGSPWLMVAVDNARATKAACPDFKPDRIAWFAMRLPDP